MKKDKLEIGQKIMVTKKPNRPTAVEIGDLAVECGFTSGEPFDGQHQFHSIDLVNIGKQRENYWVEFLPRYCYQILTPHPIKNKEAWSKPYKDNGYNVRNITLPDLISPSL